MRDILDFCMVVDNAISPEVCNADTIEDLTVYYERFNKHWPI